MMQTKNINVEIRKSDDAAYDGVFIMSAATPDRVNDTIDPKSYDIASRQEKLIALWQHDPEKPVGFWSNMKRQGDALKGYLKIADTNLGKMIKQLVLDGVPLGASIGFRGRGEPNKKGGIHFKEIELMECSVVSIPAHPRAMLVAKQFQLEEFIDPLSDGIDDVAASGLNADEIIARAKAATLVANKVIKRR
jgi:HK97 family phage prohead protease